MAYYLGVLRSVTGYRLVLRNIMSGDVAVSTFDCGEHNSARIAGMSQSDVARGGGAESGVTAGRRWSLHLYEMPQEPLSQC